MITIRNKWKNRILIGVLCLIPVLCGCSSEVSNIGHAQEAQYSGPESGTEVIPVGSYDSADTAVLEQIDTDEQKVTLMNLESGRSYTLEYSGSTYFYNKYGDGISAAQVEQGCIASVKFLKDTRKMVSFQVAPESWTYSGVSRYNLKGPNSTATIGDRTYALDSNVRVFSDQSAGSMMDIISGDVLNVSGVGSSIYSVTIETGHGYIRLTNDSALVGGWIEVGNRAITQVTESMMLVVPEGTYTIHMYHYSSDIVQEVTVSRNQEVVLDASEIKQEEDRNGYVLFQFTPSGATLKLDGQETDYSQVVSVPCGIHHMEVSAPGYTTVGKYINVGIGMATIVLNLDEDNGTEDYDRKENDSNSIWDDTSSTVSGNTTEYKNVPKDPGKYTGNYFEDRSKDNTVSGNGNSGGTSTVSGNSSASPSPAPSGTPTASPSPEPGTGSDTPIVNPTTGNKVYIDSPIGVEVYLDEEYIGRTPVNFKKEDGVHTISLRCDGYETKSYTIYLYYDEADITYSFPTLSPLRDE